MTTKPKNYLLRPTFVTLSCKLKLDVSKDEYAELKEFSDIYQNGLNFVSQISFENKLLSSRNKLHELSYSTLRTQFSLPSQSACSLIRDVAAKYKARKTGKKNKKSKKSQKQLEKPFKFGSSSISFQYKKDFSFKNNKVSIKTLNGRIKVSYYGLYRHLELMETYGIGGGILFFDKKKKKVYLIVTVKVPTEFKPIEQYEEFIGIDLGQRKLAVTIDNSSRWEMFRGERVKEKKDKYVQLRKDLQSKGTRSAKRRLISLSGRERRFMKDVNHQIAKRISKENCFLSLENLSGIRKFIESPTRETDSKKKKAANRKKSQWSFASLQFFLEYKFHLKGSLVAFIDPWMTSRTCPECGHEELKNRNKEVFLCKKCSYLDDADIVGSKNILMRGLYLWKMVSTGQLSNVPDGTDDEVKAWWRSRYQELRWSSVPSLALRGL